MFLWIKRILRKWVAEDTIGWQPALGPRTVEEGAADLVERARVGDQVAMAGMMLIRETAEKEPQNEKAQRSFKALLDYAKSHPHKARASSFGAEIRRQTEASRLGTLMTSSMGSEAYPKALVNIAPEIAKNSVPVAITTLANGPSLLEVQGQEPLIQTIADSIEDPQVRAAFALGVKHSDQALAEMKKLSPECQAMLRLGFLLGQARKIQAVRLKKSPISSFCADAAWELGEGPDVQP